MSDAHAFIDQHTAAMRTTWDAAAAGWDNHSTLIRTWLSAPTAAMLDAAGIQLGHHVLDVAAGAGDQTIDIARRIGPRGHVVAIDLSPQLVARAKSNLERDGCKTADVRVGNGEALGLNATFDAAVCRLGLMFYANPLVGLIELRRALKPGARAAVLVFSGPAQNPLIVEQLAIAARHAGIAPPDPCQSGGLLSLGDPLQLTALFAHAGFADIACRAIAAPMTLPSVSEYIDFLRTAAGPVVQMASRLADPQRAALWSNLERAFERYQTSDGWCGPNELILVSGHVET